MPWHGHALGFGLPGAEMQSVMNGYKGLSLLVWLNWDGMFALGTVIVGLLAGAFLGSVLSDAWVIQNMPAAF